MVKVRIKNMMFYGFHGYYEYEREQGQKFFFDVEMLKNDDAAVDSDDLKDGVDTARVYDVVKYVTENSNIDLNLPELIRPENFKEINGGKVIYKGLLKEYY